MPSCDQSGRSSLYKENPVKLDYEGINDIVNMLNIISLIKDFPPKCNFLEKVPFTRDFFLPFADLREANVHLLKEPCT